MAAAVRVALEYLCTGSVAPLVVNGRRFASAIGKRPRMDAVPLGPLGLADDEQADPTVHGGLDKAVYAWPVQHHAWWQAQRRQRAVDLLDEALPPGFVGENLGLRGLDAPLTEADVYVGDELHLGDAVLRVTEPRQPCFKFAAVMGYAQAGRDMVQSQRCGFYLAVVQVGALQAGQTGSLLPGPRALSIAQALHAKRYKHIR
ncbi:MOSC domain-containing protein [Tepidimonas charontis]|uniref:MOSC domain protein n=1 Tax=Tepidimonas charontis TaxID=2267262 RepID=A0A554XHF5_9BURK|nr:MOSC domain-containing protein [Tepidimonas charontis]TSE35265.1 MOSC domain protein [Tepidimonas charontis]